jgi:hypothetical protein
LIAQRHKARLLEVVAIEHVVGVEGNEAFAIGVGDVDAGLLDGAKIEGLGVDELDDEDTEEILVAEVFGCQNLRQAAQEFAQRAGLRLRRVIRGEQLEDLVSEDGILLDVFANSGVLLVDDGIAAAVDEHVGRDHAGERDDFASQLHGIGHSERVGVAGDGDEVFGLEDSSLREDAAADFREGNAVSG